VRLQKPLYRWSEGSAPSPKTSPPWPSSSRRPSPCLPHRAAASRGTRRSRRGKRPGQRQRQNQSEIGRAKRMRTEDDATGGKGSKLMLAAELAREEKRPIQGPRRAK